MVRMLMKQSFQPNALSILINPFFFIRRGLYRYIVKNAGYMNGKMLDFGCGRKPYKDLFRVDHYIGVDIAVSGHPHRNSEIDVFYDGKTLPFESDIFDSFFCSEVFEHVFNIDEVLNELNRVLKPGGKGLITVPFVWPEHEVPYDFARYTSFGIKSILERKGFKIISLEKSGHFFECLVQQSAMYLYSLYSTQSATLNGVFTILLVAPLNIVGGFFSWILPRKDSAFHNLIIVVEKPA